MLTALCLLLAGLSAAAFHLAAAHQQLWPRGRSHVRVLRVIGLSGLACAWAAGIAALGLWAGTFTALSGAMLVAMLLPYADAGLRLHREHTDAG